MVWRRIIAELELVPHPEGGWYRELYRSSQNVDTPLGPRSALTTIYYLLQSGQRSRWHVVDADEVWHFYTGDPLLVYEITHSGRLVTHRLGGDPEKEDCLVAVVRAGNWFGSTLADGGDYALVGCTVAPGFDFADFELAARSALVRQYPEHSHLIERLTR